MSDTGDYHKEAVAECRVCGHGQSDAWSKDSDDGYCGDSDLQRHAKERLLKWNYPYTYVTQNYWTTDSNAGNIVDSITLSF